MSATLLAITAVLVMVAGALFIVSFRRADAAPALAGMTVMIAAAIPAGLHATLFG